MQDYKRRATTVGTYGGRALSSQPHGHSMLMRRQGQAQFADPEPPPTNLPAAGACIDGQRNPAGQPMALHQATNMIAHGVGADAHACCNDFAAQTMGQ